MRFSITASSLALLRHPSSIRGLSSHSRHIIDLRSDTVTKPSPEMRKVMAEAIVGDDVYGEDSTINELQSRVASLLGKEAGLFVPSGTQSNLVAIGAHCNRGDEILLGDESHIFIYEGGGASALLGASFMPCRNLANGEMNLEELEEKVRILDDHFPTTSLLCIENTHNKCGGKVLPPKYISELRRICDKNSLKLHLDGARLWNASASLDISMADLCADVDTISVCLSKGLGAPVGSVLVGPKTFIDKARRIRKMTGGGMRQAGILAQAGLFAIENNFPRIKADHQRARRLVEGLAQYGNTLEVPHPDEVHSNIIYFDSKLGKGPEIMSRMEEFGIKIGSYGDTRLRLTTHIEITDDDVNHTLNAFSQVLQNDY
jgi:threonine aldolase